MATKVVMWWCIICASACTARGSVGGIGNEGLANRSFGNGRKSHSSNDSNVPLVLKERFSVSDSGSDSTSGNTARSEINIRAASSNSGSQPSIANVSNDRSVLEEIFSGSSSGSQPSIANVSNDRSVLEEIFSGSSSGSQPSIANVSNDRSVLEEIFSGSGTGSGSTSGREDVEEEDEICSKLPQNEHNNGDDIISSTAYSEVSCHVTCMEEVADSSDHQNASIQSGIFAGSWRYLTFAEFKKSDRRNTCPAYRKFKLCYRGCIVRIQPTKANLTRNQCKRDCRSNCIEERKVDRYYNSYCEVKCFSKVCLLGCAKFTEIHKAQNTTCSPQGPVTGPQLVSTGPGLYQLNHTVSAPAQNTVHPVGLVYHIVDILTSVNVFISQIDPGEAVDLQRFVCRSISVSYAAVNKYGASVESPPIILTIPGALNPPTIESISRDVDTRLGFFGYGVVTVSWQHPKCAAVVYTEHYTVTMLRFNVGKQTWKVLNNVTFLTIRAETTGYLFRLRHRYGFQVCSVSGNEEECDEKVYYLLPVPDTVLQITSCASHWTGTHFNYTIEWTIPDYVAFAGVIINSFNLGADLQFKGRTISHYSIDVVEKNTNQTTYSATRTKYRPQTSDHSYHFTVSIHWGRSVLYSRRGVISKDCTVKALPPPPSPVLNVNIAGIAIAEDHLQFQFIWDPPTSTNGDVAEYWACLSIQILENEDEESFRGSKDNVTCVLINKTSSSHSWDYRVPVSDCAFFQMRANTELRAGDWSEEIAISTKPYDGISLECLVIDRSEDEMSSVEVSWAVHNETLCIHLEAAPIHNVEITFEAADENSSLLTSLASVKLPLGKNEYTFRNIPTSNDTVFFIEFEATGNLMKPYSKGLMAQCVRVLPSPHTPSNTTSNTTSDSTPDTSISAETLFVVLGVAIAIIILSNLLLICVVCQRRRLHIQKALKTKSPEHSAVNPNLTAHSSTTPQSQSKKLSRSLPLLPTQTNTQNQVLIHQLLLGHRKQASEGNICIGMKATGRNLEEADEERSKSETEF